MNTSTSAISELHDTWEQLARADPLWAILSDPEKKGSKWTLDEFFRTGEQEIEFVFAQLQGRGVLPNVDGKALDFGCGVGRLTQALGSKFRQATGVDISETMIRLANENNQHPKRCVFVHNTRPDLAIFEDQSFDFLYTNVVLQHIPQEISTAYLAEFVRILAPGGLLAFQVADSYTPPERNLRDMLNDLRAKAAIGTRLRRMRNRLTGKRIEPSATHYGMYLLPTDVIKALFADQPGRFVMEVYSNATETDFNGELRFSSSPLEGDWKSKFYVWQKER